MLLWIWNQIRIRQNLMSLNKKKYQTSNGSKYRILKTERPSDYPINNWTRAFISQDWNSVLLLLLLLYLWCQVCNFFVNGFWFFLLAVVFKKKISKNMKKARGTSNVTSRRHSLLAHIRLENTDSEKICESLTLCTLSSVRN